MSAPDPAASSADAEPVGSVAEEAFKLFRAMTSGDHARTSSDAQPDSADHVCSTAWCPVCQVVGFVRANPDVAARVSQSGAAFVRSLRDVVDTALIPREKT